MLPLPNAYKLAPPTSSQGLTIRPSRSFQLFITLTCVSATSNLVLGNNQPLLKADIPVVPAASRLRQPLLLSTVMWTSLGLSPADIERADLVRGSNV